jgi:ketosteroid isomerase-like protein
MDEIGKGIIQMEKAALDRWGKGDPGGFLEICAPDVVYFDPYREKRIDGYQALTALYESIRGQVHFDRFELINPLVQVSGELAVLTFNYISYSGDQASRWNCTEVYRRESDSQWRIVHSHWSYTNVFKYQKG